VHGEQDTEIPLLDGNVSESVVRVGDTVRKPVTASTRDLAPGTARMT
jgi:hypothetical protein